MFAGVRACNKTYKKHHSSTTDERNATQQKMHQGYIACNQKNNERLSWKHCLCLCNTFGLAYINKPVFRMIK